MKNGEVLKMADKYGVSVPPAGNPLLPGAGACFPLPKTANPAHMKNNADVDFSISEDDMTVLKNLEKIRDYGDAGIFPVYGGKLK